MTNLKLFERELTPFDILFKNFFESNSHFFPAEEAKIPHPIDIYENKDGLHFEVACTGLDKEDLEIGIEGDILKISYDKAKTEGIDTEDLGLVRYIHRGIAKRSINIGYKISSQFDLSQSEAKMENGLLKISIPHSKETKTKLLTIK
jgi:HSP20 family protein